MRHAVELLSTGSELLNGRSLNRHAQSLGQALAPLGWTLERDTTLPDDATALREALASACSRVEVVLVSGGLGPTSDDLTRDVVAGLLGVGLRMDEPSRAAIHELYARRGKPLNASVDRHALVVEGAAVLANRAGLAPGERIDYQGRTIFLLPGPPREFAAILEDHVLPWLRARDPGLRPPIQALFQICGPGESDIVSRLEPLGFPEAGLSVAYCAHPGRVELRITAADEAHRPALERTIQLVRRALGRDIFAEDHHDLTAVVSDMLLARGQTVATAESCTGGLLGGRLTDRSGSSRWYRGGVVAYANELKRSLLDVPAEDLDVLGAVSEPVARAMAEGVRRRCGADWGLSITGIAGPEGGTAGKPVGLVYIGCAGPDGVNVVEHRLGGDRALVREWALQHALDQLRRRLHKPPGLA